MSAITTLRADVVAGIVAMLNGVKTANPDLLRAVYAARPEGFPDLPAAFVDSRPENVVQDSGNRDRILSPSFMVVRRLTNNAEAMAAFDVLVDILVDAVTANPQFAPGSMHSGNFTIEDLELAFGEYDFAAVRFTLANVSKRDGRL